jgi:hypothetical protein
MKLRPRNYGTMNRLIARGVTYAVNDLARKRKWDKRNVKCQENKNNIGLSTFYWLMFVMMLFFVLVNLL